MRSATPSRMVIARLAILLVSLIPTAALAGAQLQIFQTRYYDIHTDLDVDDVKEAAVRMTRMFEEYRLRTRGFSGDINQRLPFYLYRNSDDYYDAGGLPGSGGMFNGTALMAIAGEHTSNRTWQVIQHEGFHQFAAAVIRGNLPTWLNEGIAEYFSESLFTGDGYISGVIPPGRLKRVKQEIEDGKFKSIKDMMLTGQQQWNSKLTTTNYDQAWSMVHFLAHGDEGRYQNTFVSFMQLLGRGLQWPMAWQKTFGDASGFEQRWKDWWLKQPENPSAAVYAQARAATMTSFLGRAAAQKQRFADFDSFASEAESETVKTGDTIDLWLPPSLLRQTIGAVRKSDQKWSIRRGESGSTELIGTIPDGTRLVGTYLLRGGQFAGSSVEVDDTALVVRSAEALIQQGKRDQGRMMLRQSLQAHPKSPLAAEMRKLIRQAQ